MGNQRTISASLAVVAVALLLAVLPAHAANCDKNPNHHSCGGDGGDGDPGGGDDGSGDGGGAAPFEPVIVHPVAFNFSRSDLYLLNQDGSASSVLLEGAKSVGYSGASWSPSGDAIAFVQSAGNPGGLFTIGIDGSNMASRYQETDTEQVVGRAAWHPTGGWIAFGISYTTEAQPEGDFDVVVVAADTDFNFGPLTNLTAAFLPPGEGLLSLELSPAWSAGGDRLAMRRIVDYDWPNRMQIVVCDFLDFEVPQLECSEDDAGTLIPLDEAKRLSDPAWHPSYDQIAYAVAPREIDGNQPLTELFIKDYPSGSCRVLLAGGSEPSDGALDCGLPISVDLAEFRAIAWSCDGNSLIVNARGAQGTGLYRVDLDYAAAVSPLRFPTGKERGVGAADSRRGCG